MGFQKGISGNSAGRPTGSKNVAGAGLRNLISDFLQENFEQVTSDFAQLEPKDKIKIFIDLLQYSVPKLQSTNVTNDLEQQLEVLSDEQLESLMNRILEHNNN
jgi:hypothetical protein